MDRHPLGCQRLMAENELRLDKWLFHARLFKSRGLAADRIEGGGIRLNGQPCRKPGRAVKPGDRLVVSAYGHVHSIEIVALGARRGPAAEAQALYTDLVASEGQSFGD